MYSTRAVEQGLRPTKGWSEFFCRVCQFHHGARRRRRDSNPHVLVDNSFMDSEPAVGPGLIGRRRRRGWPEMANRSIQLSYAPGIGAAGLEPATHSVMESGPGSRRRPKFGSPIRRGFAERQWSLYR